MAPTVLVELPSGVRLVAIAGPHVIPHPGYEV